jgi:hypothetical protein
MASPLSDAPALPSRLSRGAIAGHVVLFVYLAIGLGAFWLAMKPEPALLFLVPLVAHAGARAAGAAKLKKALAAFCVWVGLALTSTVGMYAAAIAIAPPVDDEGHHLMPMGQAFSAMVLGPILGSAIGYVVAKKLEPAPRLRDLGLHALLLLLGAIATAAAIREWG